MKVNSFVILAFSLFILAGCASEKPENDKKELKIDSNESSQVYEETSLDQFTNQSKDDTIDINKAVETIKKFNDYQVASTKYYESVEKELENMGIQIDSPQIKYKFSQYGYDNSSLSVVNASIVLNEKVEELNNQYTIKFTYREASSPIGETSIKQIGKNVQNQLKEEQFFNLNSEVTYQLYLDQNLTTGKLILE